MQVNKQQLELDMEKQAGSKLGKEYVKAVYCHSDYLTYMQSTSSKMWGWRSEEHTSELQSPTAVILDPKKSVTVSLVSPSICHEVMGSDAMILIF